MIFALKCANCGFLCMSREDEVTLEIDFFEKSITYICPQCKKNNVMQAPGGATEKAEASRLPRIGTITG